MRNVLEDPEYKTQSLPVINMKQKKGGGNGDATTGVLYFGVVKHKVAGVIMEKLYEGVQVKENVGRRMHGSWNNLKQWRLLFKENVHFNTVTHRNSLKEKFNERHTGT